MKGVRIGLGVSRECVRGMAVARDGRVLWQASTPRAGEEQVTDVLARLWRDLPAATRGAHVIAVVGPAEGQLRQLTGLPKVRVAAELSALVRENAERFFVHEGSRLRVSTPHSFANGDVWAAAVPESLVADLAQACREAALRFDGAVPISAALARLASSAPAQPDEPSPTHLRWVDDGVHLCVELEERSIVRVVRMRVASKDLSTGDYVRPLPEASVTEFADAFAATRLRVTDPFVIGQNTDDYRAARRSTLRFRIWWASAALLLATAALAPGVIATRNAERARARLVALQARERVLRRAEAALARATTDLDLIARFDASRRSTTVLLGEIAYALPESTAITALRVDSLGGTMTLVTPSAGEALQAISAVPQLAHTQLSGSVTRELTAGVELEHATLRFSFGAPRTARPRVETKVYGASSARGTR